MLSEHFRKMFYAEIVVDSNLTRYSYYCIHTFVIEYVIWSREVKRL